MAMPRGLRSLIAECSQKVGNHPDHRLEPAQRVRLYKLIGPPVQDDLCRFYRWLGVLTAYKVLPIWTAAAPALMQQRIERSERYGAFIPDYALPEKVLAMAEADLRGVAAETYDAGIDTEFGSFDFDVSYPVYLASQAAYLVMHLFIDIEYSYDSMLYTLSTLTGEALFVDENAVDVAEAAVRSYSCITPLPYAEMGRNIDYDELIFDPGRRLEFWQWWLHEALPQAVTLSGLYADS